MKNKNFRKFFLNFKSTSPEFYIFDVFLIIPATIGIYIYAFTLSDIKEIFLIMCETLILPLIAIFICIVEHFNSRYYITINDEFIFNKKTSFVHFVKVQHKCKVAINNILKIDIISDMLDSRGREFGLNIKRIDYSLGQGQWFCSKKTYLEITEINGITTRFSLHNYEKNDVYNIINELVIRIEKHGNKIFEKSNIDDLIIKFINFEKNIHRNDPEIFLYETKSKYNKNIHK